MPQDVESDRAHPEIGVALPYQYLQGRGDVFVSRKND